MRTLDVIGRYGGEEFAVLLPEINLSQAEMTAERLRKLISGTEFSVEGNNINVTASFGVSAYDSNKADNIEEMIRLADNALYKAKRRGRNKVVLSTTS